jgi:hypothetical protein
MPVAPSPPPSEAIPPAPAATPVLSRPGPAGEEPVLFKEDIDFLRAYLSEKPSERALPLPSLPRAKSEDEGRPAPEKREAEKSRGEPLPSLDDILRELENS